MERQEKNENSSSQVGLRLASYNIHRCYGLDGQYSPSRIRQVLRMLGAEVIALQEVELLHKAPDLLDFLCHDSPWQAVKGMTLTRGTGHYGNALLSALPIRSVKRIDLSVSGREPRGALYALLENQGCNLAVVATHLGLRPAERRMQIHLLLQFLQRRRCPPPTVLMGDLNEWFLWGRPLRWLRSFFGQAPAPGTFPTRKPFFALDRIWMHPPERLQKITTLNTPLTRVASDHLPLVAQIS